MVYLPWYKLAAMEVPNVSSLVYKLAAVWGFLLYLSWYKLTAMGVPNLSSLVKTSSNKG